MTKTRAILILAATMLLAACNTMQGFGKDLESAGKTVSDAAK
ncbi:entericidin A/B family lipoprotein [Sphingoaurantiacus capsulatus]|uniref:Entericidin A/B family lipoprotein n=1 Tax=Sphingoaurantiacus capsulatus TaxID=1771310 RepID=A0ABV7X6R4_9SPHN